MAVTAQQVAGKEQRAQAAAQDEFVAQLRTRLAAAIEAFAVALMQHTAAREVVARATLFSNAAALVESLVKANLSVSAAEAQAQRTDQELAIAPP